MSITVADCLKLPSLKGADIVSGRNGLTKIVTSISVLEYLEPFIMNNHGIFRANEMIITAFASIKDDVQTQCRAIDMLYESGDVALILFYVGYFVPALDPSLLAKSDLLDFPIIVMPIGRTDIGYSEVISEISEAVFNDKRQQSRFENTLLERISQLPDHQRTVQNILQMISIQLKCSLLIANHHNERIHFVKRGIAKWHNEADVLKQFENRPYMKPYEVLEGNEYDSVKFYRIPFTKNIYSHLSLIAVDDNAFASSADLLSAIELIETSAEIWKYDLDSSGLDALIPAILHDHTNRIQQIANSFHITAEAMHTAVIVRQTAAELSPSEQYKINSLLAHKAKNILTSNGYSPIVNVYGNQLIVLLKTVLRPEYDDLLAQFIRSFHDVHSPITIFIQKNLPDIFYLKKLIHSYNESFSFVRIIYPLLTLFNESHLAFAAECSTLIAEATPEKHFLSTLQNRENDKNLIDTLIGTLTVYLLDADNDTRLTSKIMFVHRNTVQFRLNKLKQLLGYDFNKKPEVYLLYRAVAVKRLMDAISKK